MLARKTLAAINRCHSLHLAFLLRIPIDSSQSACYCSVPLSRCFSTWLSAVSPKKTGFSLKRFDLIFNTPVYFHTYFLQQSLKVCGYRVSTTIPWYYPAYLNWYQPGQSIVSPAHGIAKRMPQQLLKSRVLWKALSAIDQFWFLCFFVFSRAVLSRSDVFGELRGFLLKYIFNVRQYCVLTSCAQEARMSTWQSVPGCDICSFCELRIKNLHYCKDHHAQRRIASRKNFSSGEIATGAFPYSETPNELMVPFYCCSRDQFHPRLKVPKGYLLKRDTPDQLLILHSYAQDDSRLNEQVGLNTIKGTDHLLHAVQALKAEGLNIKLINLTGYNQQDLRYLQVQADLCVDELRYGWWGSTPLECAALGVPTIVYINYLFAAFWQKNYPEFATLIPFLSADTTTITDVLRMVCLDPALRNELRQKSLRFAQAYLDPDRNAHRLAEALEL